MKSSYILGVKTVGKIMRQAWLCVVIFGILIIPVFAGCSSPAKVTTTTNTTVWPTINYTTVTNTTFNTTTPITLVTDSFNVIPYTNETQAEWEAQHITDINQLTLPYSNYGMYISNLFWVNQGETLQIIINSDVPAYDFPNGVNNGGLETALTQASSGVSGATTVISSNSNRTQAGFTTTLVHSIGISGDYYLAVKNRSTQNCVCRVTVSILK